MVHLIFIQFQKKINQFNFKIYDFNLRELPILTKILTLASLQGIADILSGEGITFDEFEMNFRNEKELLLMKSMQSVQLFQF